MRTLLEEDTGIPTRCTEGHHQNTSDLGHHQCSAEMVQCHQDTNKSQAEGEVAGEMEVHHQGENLTDLRDLATTLAIDLSEWTRSAINLLKSSTRMPTTKLNKKESSALREMPIRISSSTETQEIREIGQVRPMPTLKRNENRPFFHSLV